MTGLLCSLWLFLTCLLLQVGPASLVLGSFVPARQSGRGSGQNYNYYVQNEPAKSPCDHDVALMLSTGERETKLVVDVIDRHTMTSTTSPKSGASRDAYLRTPAQLKPPRTAVQIQRAAGLLRQKHQPHLHGQKATSGQRQSNPEVHSQRVMLSCHETHNFACGNLLAFPKLHGFSRQQLR
jgi:hypothetical protein